MAIAGFSGRMLLDDAGHDGLVPGNVLPEVVRRDPGRTYLDCQFCWPLVLAQALRIEDLADGDGGQAERFADVCLGSPGLSVLDGFRSA